MKLPDAWATPNCSECGKPVTASRTTFPTTAAGRRITETMEPCGCVLDFPMPTLAQDHAAAELTAIERARASTPAWSYAIGAGAGTVIAVLAAFALVAFGLRLPWGLAQTWNVTALLSALMATAVWGRQWWFQRAHESASRRLTATSGNEQGEPL